MARAIASTTQVAYVVEATDGTTPATPTFQVFRATGESLEVQRKLVFSGEMNGFRGAKAHALAAKSGAGGFECEFSDGSLEDMLESALRAAWATDVLINANTPKSFTLETKFETGATDVYKRLSGAQVNTLSITARAQELVQAQIGFMSRLADFANAGVAGATYTAGNSESILTGDKVGSIAMSGLTLDAVHTITLNINQNLKSRPALGFVEGVELYPGDLEVSGTIGLYLADTEFDVLTAFQAATATSLLFRVGTTVGKITEFSMPNIVLEEPKPVAESKDGDILFNLNFKAMQASSLTNGLIKVTRNI